MFVIVCSLHPHSHCLIHKGQLAINGVCVCVCVCVCVQDNSKSNQSRNMKFEYVLVYENISDKFDKSHCRIEVKVMVGLEIFLHLPQYKLSGPITQLS